MIIRRREAALALYEGIIGPRTHNAVLDAEAQLVSEVRPADEHHGNRRTPDDVQLDPGLRLETLREDRVWLAAGGRHHRGRITQQKRGKRDR